MNPSSAIQRKYNIIDSPMSLLSSRNDDKPKIVDERFLKKALYIVQKHITDNEFSIEEFSHEIGMSRAQLHRKLKALTGRSASRYIMSLRLLVACDMIRNQEGNISEIAYSVGFSSPVYFSRCFKEEYGFPPSKLLEN